MKNTNVTLPQYCIWDFNGTILDDVETGIRSVNVLLAQRGLRTLAGKEEYRKVFCFPIRRYYERLGFDFDKESYETIAPLWVEQYLRYVKEAPLFEDVKETLDRFQQAGIRQVVLSATELDMLCGQLRFLGIDGYFDEVLGLDNIHAASKRSLATEWRERHPDATAIFLGDTDHDCDAADALGAPCLLVSRGHQSEAYLRGMGVPVFTSLRELCRKLFEGSL
ncbi:MAG: HAD family hydrolase [Clostridia bacterium]|nr:HAD family hydrolase [Clostridia bacterium]